MSAVLFGVVIFGVLYVLVSIRDEVGQMREAVERLADRD